MIYLSIDQSSNISGYSVWHNKELIEWGKVKFEGEFLTRVIELKFWSNSYIKNQIPNYVEFITIIFLHNDNEYITNIPSSIKKIKINNKNKIHLIKKIPYLCTITDLNDVVINI